MNKVVYNACFGGFSISKVATDIILSNGLNGLSSMILNYVAERY